jgi:hypothetical protein
MRDSNDDLEAKATSMFVGTVVILFIGVFIALFRKPKIMIPILLLSGLMAYFFKEQGIVLALGVSLGTGFFISMPYIR